MSVKKITEMIKVKLLDGFFFYVDNFHGLVYTLMCKHIDVLKLLHHYKSLLNNWQQKLEINRELNQSQLVLKSLKKEGD